MHSRTQRIGVFGDRPPLWVGEQYWWILKRRLIQLTVIIVRKRGDPFEKIKDQISCGGIELNVFLR